MSEDVLADKIRKRIESEDELFNSRTTIFLATNGLWAAAVGVGNALHLQIGIGILGVLVSIMWVMCSWQSSNVIKALRGGGIHALALGLGLSPGLQLCAGDAASCYGSRANHRCPVASLPRCAL